MRRHGRAYLLGLLARPEWRRHLLDGLEAADEAVTGVEREVTGGVFVGYGVVIGLAGESGYVIAGQPWLGDQAGQVASGANSQAAPATAQTTWRIEPGYGRMAVSQS